MERIETVVVGAGVAGLAAAQRLARAGRDVVVLEARDRVGGRIKTLHRGDGPPVELGAEFVHGLPPATCGLVREAGLRLFELEGDHACRLDTAVCGCDELFESVAGKLADAPEAAVSIAERLGSGWSDPERALALSYVEGFYAAEIDDASARAVADQERAAASIEGQRSFRLLDGYDRLPAFLARGLDVRLATPVRTIRWRSGAVEVRSDDGCWRADRAVITLPLGVLQAGDVRFEPAPALHAGAWSRLRMGDVVKLVLAFDEPFWLERIGRTGFLHAPGEPVPTWWSAWPGDSPYIVGWTGGGAARRLRDRDALEPAALRSLSSLFGKEERWLEGRLRELVTHDWRADPFSRGAYAYVPVGGLDASAILRAPVEETLHFAGEHTEYESIGTVSGAIASGERAADRILRSVGEELRT